MLTGTLGLVWCKRRTGDPAATLGAALVSGAELRAAIARALCVPRARAARTARAVEMTLDGCMSAGSAGAPCRARLLLQRRLPRRAPCSEGVAGVGSTQTRNRRCPVIVTEMTSEECREALAKAGFGRLACARDNQPYAVPVFFAVDEDYLYSFSVAGQKIDWMRDNPRVCLEIDSVKSWNDWTTVVAFGRYDELPDTPDWQDERRRALGLLQQRAMWWQPGSVKIHNHAGRACLPIFFRITLERLTGHRGASGSDEVPHASAQEYARGGWLRHLFQSAQAKA